jgi:hypothetical protein
MFHIASYPSFMARYVPQIGFASFRYAAHYERKLAASQDLGILAERPHCAPEGDPLHFVDSASLTRGESPRPRP